MGEIRRDRLTSRNCPDCGGPLGYDRLLVAGNPKGAGVWRQIIVCRGCDAMFDGPMPPLGWER